ncbi:hypothetical protein H8A95_34520 [Bradyrhizobium sp. Pear76]|nr:hypothetical protein [Bradyrhizobium oropedii]
MRSTMSNRGLVAKFDSPFDQKTVIIEDDGRVAYAYLLDCDGRIRSDVWLYNRCQTPVEPEWYDPTRMPFANPAPFATDDLSFSPPDSPGDITVEWGDSDSPDDANVFISGKHFARLRVGMKPGWSALAAKDGPLAQVLKEPF